MSEFSASQRIGNVLREIDFQPNWRITADRCAQYYDGNQLEPEVIAELERKRMPRIIVNLIKPTINGVLGMEARNRTDWHVSADNDEYIDIAEGLNEKVLESLRIAKANRAVSDAYAAQVIPGIGWVEVKKNNDPLGSKYKISYVHRDEIYYDFATDSDLSNCKWLLRKRWVDKEQALAAFPKHKDIIRYAIGGWNNLDFSSAKVNSHALQGAYDEFQYSTRSMDEWLNNVRDNVMVYELYYRVWKNGIILRDNNSGRVVVFDEKNPIHIALIASNAVEVERRMIPSLRLSWYVGPHHIIDMPSPHPHNYFPYVPFFGAREDKSRIPYGLVRDMLSPQDELNFRRIKLTAQLNHKRIIKDEDAVKMTDERLREEVHSSDGVVTLNPSARRKGGGLFKVETDNGIAAQQYQVMNDSKMLLQDVSGVHDAFLGKEGAAKSGIAINSLVEQSATTMGDINDNYMFARQMVGELVLAHEINDLKPKRNIKVIIPAKSSQEKPREVVLNEEGENGELNNDISLAKTKVVLGEVQQSAGYRAQVTQMLIDLISKLPQQVQFGALDIVVEQMDLPADKKDRLLKVISKVTGNINPEDMTEEEKAALQAEQQKKQAAEQLDMAAMQLKLKQVEALISEITSKANLNTAKSETEKINQLLMQQSAIDNGVRPPPLPTQQ